MGSAVMTFAVVPRPEHLVDIRIDMTAGRRRMSAQTDADTLDRDYLAEVAPDELAQGQLRIAMRPQIANTVGALHGAVHATLIDEASASLGRHLLGGPCATIDMHLAYLELGRTSPITVSATPVGEPLDGRLACVVEVRDGDGNLSSHATTEVVRT
jgi:acyl-coenzyme A thioesterase PaaI-like protein